MARHQVNGVAIEIESRGKEEHPAFVLVRGLSTQLVQWPERFASALTEAGFRVVAFDNRDAGLSEKLTGAGAPSLAELLGGSLSPPYTVADMAADTVGVLDALGIERAHFAGISMGGMIVQRVAIAHPERCLSMASIMSSSGAPGLPAATPEAMEALTSQPEDPTDRECVIAHSMRTQRVIGSPGLPMTEDELRRYCEVAYDRCYCPDGTARQLAAVAADLERAGLLGRIAVPSLVIHGREDPLIPLAAGEDTAARIPGARFEVIDGMGHDINDANSPHVTRALIAHARAAEGRSA